MRQLRWSSISLVFQAAMNSLNPVYRVGEQIIEALDEHMRLNRKEAHKRVRELFDLVGLDHALIDYYPHEYSGGMKQRAVIAMALSCDPDIVIADEPTTALDVIVQDRILREMKRVREELDMSMIYISHDMAVIAEVSDVVGVMYAGRIVELGSTKDVFNNPIHPYTKALLSAFPSVTGDKQELVTLPGEPPTYWSRRRAVVSIRGAPTLRTPAGVKNHRQCGAANTKPLAGTPRLAYTYRWDSARASRWPT